MFTVARLFSGYCTNNSSPILLLLNTITVFVYVVFVFAVLVRNIVQSFLIS